MPRIVASAGLGRNCGANAQLEHPLRPKQRSRWQIPPEAMLPCAFAIVCCMTFLQHKPKCLRDV